MSVTPCICHLPDCKRSANFIQCSSYVRILRKLWRFLSFAKLHYILMFPLKRVTTVIPAGLTRLLRSLKRAYSSTAEVKEELEEVLADIMKRSMLTKEIPQDWRDTNIVQMYKKRNSA